jgi:hypothetical protein
MHITTHIEGRKDEDLLQKKGGMGFPYIVFMDETGDVLVQQGARTVAGFQTTLGKLQSLFDARAKAKAGDAAAAIDVALMEGDLEIAAFADVQKRLEGKTLTETQKTLLGELELLSLMDDVTHATDEGTANAAMKKVADVYAQGRMPNSGERKMLFFRILLQHGITENDADLAQKALDAVKPLMEEAYGKDNPQLQSYFQKVADKIAEMRQAAKGETNDGGIEEGCGDGGGDKDK